MSTRAASPAKPSAPNPLWRYSAPQASRDGRVVWVDAMQLPTVHAHYERAGIELVRGRSPR